VAGTLSAADRARIARAITLAEDGTSGSIAVRVVNDPHLNAIEKAKDEFLQIGLHDHTAGNAALVLVAPRARQFAVIGDRALHARVGDAFWQQVTLEMRGHFAYGQLADGIVLAVERLGEQLHEHFPTRRPA
jgi:uncharacterized membrane protein